MRFLRARVQPVEQFRNRGAGVGVLPPAAAQCDQCVGFLAARGDWPSRAMILEGPPHQPHAIGQQGRGQRIARMTAIALPVEGETSAGCGQICRPYGKSHPAPPDACAQQSATPQDDRGELSAEPGSQGVTTAQMSGRPCSGEGTIQFACRPVPGWWSGGDWRPCRNAVVARFADASGGFVSS